MALAKPIMDRKPEGRRTSSELPKLVELVMAKPLVLAAMVAKTLDLTPQATRRIVSQLGLREMTGRGRFRAWVLGIGRISTPFLKAFLDRYAQHAMMIEFQATGHWIPEERPAETAAAILELLGQP